MLQRLIVPMGLVAIVLCGCGSRKTDAPRVVVYTSVDQVYAEPILKAFEEETGIEVRAVYDIEAAKTTGLVNRLLAEASRPQADVFWSGEFVQTMQLKREGVLAPYVSPAASDIPPEFRDPAGFWTGFAGRARVFIVNTERLPASVRPKTVADLVDPPWPAEQSAVAMPRFGTTATHAAALYAAWGPARARAFFQKLHDSGVRIVDGNSVVRDMVADGRAMIGLTDTDDAAAAVARGAPVEVVYPDQGEDGLGTFIVPNTVALIKDSPNPDRGKRLVDFLLRRSTENRLVESGWCHVPVREVDADPKHLPSPKAIRRMSLNLEAIYAEYGRSGLEMAEIFGR